MDIITATKITQVKNNKNIGNPWSCGDPNGGLAQY